MSSDFHLMELCFEVTGDCLLKCRFCSTFNDRDRRVSPFYVDVDVFEETIGAFQRLGGRILEISGGEPLLHPSVTKLVQSAKDRGLQVRLYTSGVARSDTIRLIRDLAEAGLDRVIFNCQGLGKDHDSLVEMDGAFEQMFGALKASKDAGLWVGTHTIPVSSNVSRLESLCQTLGKYGVDEIAFLRLVKQGRAAMNWPLLALGPKGYRQFSSVVLRLLKDPTTMRLRLGCPFQALKVRKRLQGIERNDSSYCHAGKHSLNILSDGSVVPCPAFKDTTPARLGSIFEDSLEKIWQNGAFLQELRQHSSVSHCDSCDFWSKCHGGCAAQRFIAYHEIIKGPDPLCFLLDRESCRPRELTRALASSFL